MIILIFYDIKRVFYKIDVYDWDIVVDLLKSFWFIDFLEGRGSEFLFGLLELVGEFEVRIYMYIFNILNLDMKKKYDNFWIR